MKQYDNYKDSGQQWLGEIPSHWRLRKMKFSFTERTSKGFPNESLLSATQSHGVIPQSMYENRTVQATKNLETLKLVEKGDFVISLRSFQGGIEYAYYRGIISPAYTVLFPYAIDSGFFKHLGKSQVFIDLLQSTVTGIREGQNIDYSKLKQTYLPIPPKEEQLAISHYIDRIAADIDKAIAQQQRMIDLLNERKQIIIQQAVTKGINPNVKMKNSGVEWIGQVPEHWKISKIKFFIKIKSGEALSNEKLLSEGDYIVYGGGEPIGCHSEYNVNPNSIIIGRVGARCGCVTIVKDYVWATDNALIVTAHNINNDYLASWLISADLNQLAAINAQPLLTGTKVKNTYIAIPPKEEQELIVKYINKHVKSIDVTKQRYEQQIDLLKERKQIIINNAVTGKIKII